MVEPPGPVDAPQHHLPNFHRLVAGVENDAVLFMDVRDIHGAQGAVVRRLTAALGVEGGAVQHHLEAVFPGFTGQNGGGELRDKGVCVIELFRFHVENFLSFESCYKSGAPSGEHRKKVRYGLSGW